MIGKINLNDNTVNHPSTLSALGYEVDVDVEKKQALIECEGILPQGKDVEPIDCTSLEKIVEFVQEVVDSKQLIGYNTRLLLSIGGTKAKRFGPPLCAALQGSKTLQETLGFDPSALIAIKPKVKKTTIQDIFA